MAPVSRYTHSSSQERVTLPSEDRYINTLTSPATTQMLDWFSTNLFAYNFMTFTCGVTDYEEKDLTGNAITSIITSNTVGIELQRLVIMNSHGMFFLNENSFGNILLHTLKFLK